MTTSEGAKNAIVSSAGIVVCREVSPLLKRYLKSLIFTYMPRVGPPKRCTLYRILRQPNGLEILILPRDAVSVLEECGISVRIDLAPLRLFEPHIEAPLDFLYDDQLRIIEHIRQHWSRVPASRTTACLNLRAGYGKTFIAAGIISLLRIRTLYVVPMCELAKQTMADLCATMPNLDIVYASSSEQLRAQLAPDSTTHVCVAVINTVLAVASATGIASAAIQRAFSLVILDEVHAYCSPKRMNIFWATQTHFMFGMSATMGERRDGFDFALQHHLFPIINAEDVAGFSYGENQFQCHVRAIRYYAKDEFAQNLRHETTDKVFAHYMYEQFARDPDRNALIVEQARLLLAAGHNFFIFMEERAHVEHIAQMLCSAGLVALADDPIVPRCVIFYGGVSDEERRVALCNDHAHAAPQAQCVSNAARVIIATYSYSGTGVSIVRMDAMILASPRYSGMKQIVGRILRRGSDPAIPRVIVDIIDQKTCLAHQFRLRRNAFDFYGAEYEKMVVRV